MAYHYDGLCHDQIVNATGLLSQSTLTLRGN